MNRTRLIAFGCLLLLLLLVASVLFPLSFNIWLDKHKLIHVVLIAGDDNVEGYAQLSHLSDFMDHAQEGVLERFQHLRSRENTTNWLTRDDVFVYHERERHQRQTWQVGPLNMHDYGAKPGLFGPEVEVGNVLGAAFDNPVILVKAGFTKKSLAEDWISPSRHSRSRPLGYAWVHTLKNLKYALEHAGQALGPKYKKHRAQFVGIIWWHAYSDVVKGTWLRDYEENLKLLIQDFRTELKRPHLPIVVAEAGAAGRDIDKYFFEEPMRLAQQHVCNDTTFAAAQTKCVPTFPFVHAQEAHIDRHFHYYGHGDSMIEISGVLATTLLDLYNQQYQEKELQQEMDTEYIGDVNEEESFSTGFLLGIVGLVFLITALVKRRCSAGRTVSFSNNAEYYEGSDVQQQRQSNGSSSDGRQRRRRRRRGNSSRNYNNNNNDHYNDHLDRNEGNLYSITEMAPTQMVTFQNNPNDTATSLENGGVVVTFPMRIPDSDSALVELDEISSSEEEEDYFFNKK